MKGKAIEMNTKKKYEIDMCNGPIFSKILLFAVPLMISGVLQLLFNAMDMIVVGRYVGPDALAAVGSTGSLINLMINVFMGLSVGTNVLVARYYGAGQNKELSDMVHTAVLTAFISGVILIFIGFFCSPFALRLMGSPENVLDQSVLYLRIYFAGMPAMMVYNFGSAILRAVGDTRRPLYYLIIAGVLNVILNVFFVVNCNMGVAGVALATTISQVLSAVLVILCLLRTDGEYKLYLSKLKIDGSKLFQMAKIGLPAGLQGAIFSISNVLIQSSINSFGSDAMAGNSAASNIEGFVYTSMNAIYQTAISFVGQNYGAHKFKRMRAIMTECVLTVIVVGLVSGNLAYYFGETLLGLYATETEVIKIGMVRLKMICIPYFLCGLMDTLVGCLRGLGRSLLPMFVSLTGACLFRVIWIMTVFSENRSLETLYWSYPISWTLTSLAHFVCLLIVYSAILRKSRSEE